MEPHLISCIIPVFNGERYLKEAIDSILAQTYRPIEIIVVDDGSSDGTAGVVASYDRKLRYLWQLNSGPAAARNLGLGAACGEFVAFLDADDLWHAEKLTLQMRRFQSRPELDLCLTQVQNFWILELEAEKQRYQDHRFSGPLPGYTTQALLARRDLFDRVGVFDTSLKAVDDTDWFLRAIAEGVVVEMLPEVLVHRRMHRSNLSRSQLAYDALARVLKRSLDRKRGRARRQVCL